MSKKNFTAPSWAVNTIQSLANIVKNQATGLKAKYDLGSLNIKTYFESFIVELQGETANDSGANRVGTEGTFGTNNVADEIKAIKVVTDAKANQVTTYTKTEVNALDVQNVKITGNQTISGVKTFSTLPQSSVVPTLGTQLVNKDYVASLAPITIPNNSILDIKLSTDSGQILDRFLKAVIDETNNKNYSTQLKLINGKPILEYEEVI